MPSSYTCHHVDNDSEMNIEEDDLSSETESVPSAIVFSEYGRTGATTVTSVEDDGVSMRTPSPEPEPIIHMDEQLRATLYREEFGRNLNSYSDVYKLPVDEEELDRLGIFIHVNEVLLKLIFSWISRTTVRYVEFPPWSQICPSNVRGSC